MCLPSLPYWTLLIPFAFLKVISFGFSSLPSTEQVTTASLPVSTGLRRLLNILPRPPSNCTGCSRLSPNLTFPFSTYSSPERADLFSAGHWQLYQHYADEFQICNLTFQTLLAADTARHAHWHVLPSAQNLTYFLWKTGFYFNFSISIDSSPAFQSQNLKASFDYFISCIISM